jgi:hypothetical protein
VRKQHWARIISAATQYDTAITLALIEIANKKVRTDMAALGTCSVGAVDKGMFGQVLRVFSGFITDTNSIQGDEAVVD